MRIRVCLLLIRTRLLVFTSVKLFIINLTIVISTHAALLDEKIADETPAPSINLKKCRLANYVFKYEAKRGDSTVGWVSRELIKLSKDGDMQLLSNLSASMAFMKFIQQERSLFKQYEQTGLYSTEYSKSTKKPFKSETNDTYSINKALQLYKVNCGLRNICLGMLRIR